MARDRKTGTFSFAAGKLITKARRGTRFLCPLPPSRDLENEHSQGSYPDHQLISELALLDLLKRDAVRDRQHRGEVGPALNGFPPSRAELSQREVIGNREQQ